MLIAVPDPLPPSLWAITPLFAPTAQIRLPSAVAERMLLVLNCVVVVVRSIVPFVPTRPIIRGTVVVVVPDTEVPPVVVSYPVRTSDEPSLERVNAPSDVAVPLAINSVPPVEGIGIDCTSCPAGVNSSRNTTFPLLTSPVAAFPMRYTTRSPGVNAPSGATVILNAESLVVFTPSETWKLKWSRAAAPPAV